MQTEAINVTAEDGTVLTIRVPTNIYTTRFGTPINDEHRARMSKALDDVMQGRYWKLPFKTIVQDYEAAKVLAEAAEFFHGCDATLKPTADGFGYIVASPGYSC